MSPVPSTRPRRRPTACRATNDGAVGVSDVAWQGIEDALTDATGPVGSAHGLPPVCYTDPAFFRHEAARVFHRSWVGVGRADRWKAAGDYAALDIAGVPTIVLRDKDGTLRAFANACRHRGTLLLDGEGACRAIKCPFHGWLYGLDGRLAGAPRMDETPGFDTADYGLVPFRTDTLDGFAFVCLDDAAPGLDEWLADFAGLHAEWSLADLVATRRREFDVACNWKTFLEVFNEYYHVPYVHAATIDDCYERPDPLDEAAGQFVTQFGTTADTATLLDGNRDQALPPIASLQGRNRQGIRYTWMFPNMTFAASAEAIWLYDTFPLAPDRTRVGMTVCFPPETVALADFEARAEAYYHRLDTVLAEDLPMLERQQAGLTSPFARPGRFSTYMEPSVAAFARWYAARVA